VVQKNSKTIYYLTKGLNPVITLFTGISRGILKLAGKNVSKKNLLITDDSIKSLATLGEEEGVIKGIEREIIHRVFLFGDRKIKDVMVPMKDVFYVESDLTVPKASTLTAQHGFTRVPVMSKNKEIIGVLYSKDLIDLETGSIKPLIKSPYIVSSEDDITDIFNTMREKRVHLAVVKDAKGMVVGIVTLEDILEELVGEIYDEYFDAKYDKSKVAKPIANS
jgi:putative hemolysin